MDWVALVVNHVHPIGEYDNNDSRTQAKRQQPGLEDT